ncbi:hypothetical protein [Methylocystis echinoides]|uniref:hypothetical protein n=1 Tax=Methylocystis echinoides TaxID=29468 RepID=UPI0024932C48|nr:hypothetical protein [Methylocystis echinoides]
MNGIRAPAPIRVKRKWVNEVLASRALGNTDALNTDLQITGKNQSNILAELPASIDQIAKYSGLENVAGMVEIWSFH